MKVVITKKSKKFIHKLLNDVAGFKEPNTHKILQFRRIKEVRSIVDNPLKKAAAIRMDCREKCWQEKSAYYYDMQVSVNTAVVYQANKSTTCVGSLSDNTSHKKTAVWASLKSMIDVINLDVDKLEHLYLITDSPSSQYRNPGCDFLAKKFAESNKIDVSWIFTETGHGKGHMNGVGAAIKNAIDDAVVAAESMPDVLVRSASNIHKILNLVNVEISMHVDSDIENVEITLPHHLSISW